MIKGECLRERERERKRERYGEKAIGREIERSCVAFNAPGRDSVGWILLPVLIEDASVENLSQGSSGYGTSGNVCHA